MPLWKLPILARVFSFRIDRQICLKGVKGIIIFNNHLFSARVCFFFFSLPQGLIFLTHLILSKPLLLFSHSVMSDCLQPHELQHTRLPCPSLSPWVCSNSCPLSQWWHPTISSSVIPSSSSCLQSFPASVSFPMSLLFASGGQSIGASASASFLPMNIQGQFPLE